MVQYIDVLLIRVHACFPPTMAIELPSSTPAYSAVPALGRYTVFKYRVAFACDTSRWFSRFDDSVGHHTHSDPVRGHGRRAQQLPTWKLGSDGFMLPVFMSCKRCEYFLRVALILHRRRCIRAVCRNTLHRKVHVSRGDQDWWTTRRTTRACKPSEPCMRDCYSRRLFCVGGIRLHVLESLAGVCWCDSLWWCRAI